MNDLISRQAAIEAVAKALGKGSDLLTNTFIDGISEVLSNVPSAQERKKGKWIRHYCEDGNPDGWQCDQCAEWYYFGETKPNFCPNCGADMRGEEDEND